MGGALYGIAERSVAEPSIFERFLRTILRSNFRARSGFEGSAEIGFEREVASNPLGISIFELWATPKRCSISGALSSSRAASAEKKLFHMFKNALLHSGENRLNFLCFLL